MKINRRLHRRLRLQNVVFVLLFVTLVALLGWISQRYQAEFDWTAAQRNSLSEASLRLLEQMPDPIAFTAFVTPESELRPAIENLVGRYARAREDITLEFANIDAEPERVREMDITMDGELVIAYQGRSEKLQNLNESSITNALQRLARQGERWVVFLQGHGERDPYGEGNHDLGVLGRELSRRGLIVQTLNLALSPQIPHNTTVLVVADPRSTLLAGEVGILVDYLDRGGNLVWLTEPGATDGLEPLAEALGILRLPGVVVDPTGRLLGLGDPELALVAEYPFHPITRNLATVTLFPRAVALEAPRENGWRAHPILETLTQSWTETGPLEGELRYDDDSDERPGPLTIGLALTRERPGGDGGGEAPGQAPPGEEPGPGEQRVVVIGDGDFLANRYVGNGGNLDLGLNTINWLAHDDSLIAINPKPAPDIRLELSETEMMVLAVGFLLLLPGLLLGAGLLVWLRRRRL